MLEQCGRPSCRVLLSLLTSEIGIVVVRLKRRKRESTQLVDDFENANEDPPSVLAEKRGWAGILQNKKRK